MNLTTPDLERFVQAQDAVLESVLHELATARKTSHWMWFVFPQLTQLGRSAVARHFGLDSRQQALAYWRHPVLGARLRECTRLVLQAPAGKTAHEVFGSPDDLKFRSCMTLFSQVAPHEPMFAQALARFFGARPDERTLALL